MKAKVGGDGEDTETRTKARRRGRRWCGIQVVQDRHTYLASPPLGTKIPVSHTIELTIMINNSEAGAHFKAYNQLILLTLM